jgi:outer membrane lipoprotein-sorting protein
MTLLPLLLLGSLQDPDLGTILDRLAEGRAPLKDLRTRFSVLKSAEKGNATERARSGTLCYRAPGDLAWSIAPETTRTFPSGIVIERTEKRVRRSLSGARRSARRSRIVPRSGS